MQKRQINQQRDNILPVTFGLEEHIDTLEIKDVNIHELRDEISNQKLTHQPFLFKTKIDFVGKIFESIMAFKDIGAFETNLESIDELYDEGSIIVQEEDTFIQTDRKIFIKVKRSVYDKRCNNIDKKVVR